MIAKISFSFKRFAWKTAEKLVSICWNSQSCGILNCFKLPTDTNFFDHLLLCKMSATSILAPKWRNRPLGNHQLWLSRYYAKLTETRSQSLLNPFERCLRVLLGHIGCYMQNISKFSIVSGAMCKTSRVLAVLLRECQNENHFLRIFNVIYQFI